MPYTIGEWEIILAAYAYEVEHKPLMDDQTFDLLCSHTKGENIPDFDAATGMWVHDVVADVGHEFLAAATAKLRRIGRGAAVSHIGFPPGLLIQPDWEMPTRYSHIYP